MSGGGKSVFILRIRTQIGTWRLEDVKPTDTIGHLKARLEDEHRTEFLDKPISKDPGGKVTLPLTATVASLGLKNGDMIFASVNEERTGVHEAAHTSRYIKGGNIVAKDNSHGSQDGFRPGMMALGDIKKQWTLADFISLDEQFVYKIKSQDKAVCTKVSLNEDSVSGTTHHALVY